MNETDHPDHNHHRPSPEETEYPPVLRLTSVPHEEHREDAIDRARRAAEGEAVPSVRNFDDPTELRVLLTDRRIELLRSIMAEPPASMKTLADRLERGTRQIHDDVHLLAEYGIVVFVKGDGRARKPVVPYERVEIDIGIEATDIDGDPETGARTA
jgi:predicted transcriptional regulator